MLSDQLMTLAGSLEDACNIGFGKPPTSVVVTADPTGAKLYPLVLVKIIGKVSLISWKIFKSALSLGSVSKTAGSSGKSVSLSFIINSF